MFGGPGLRGLGGGCAPCAAAGVGSLNTYDGPYPEGVPNPFTPMLHSFPTRYHGPVYTRPMYSLPYADRPNDFAIERSMMGLGEDAMEASIPPTWKVGVATLLAVVVIGGVYLLTKDTGRHGYTPNSPRKRKKQMSYERLQTRRKRSDRAEREYLKWREEQRKSVQTERGK